MAGLLLGGCEKADNAPGPGGVTVGEARALDEAAQMVESQQPPPEILRPSQAPLSAQTADSDRGAAR